MAEYTINCRANSLLEYTPDPPPSNTNLFKIIPFFTVDFTVAEISKLIFDAKGRKAAGICLVSGLEDIDHPLFKIKREKIYAFRVEWDDENLVRNPNLDSNEVVSATITAMTEKGAVEDFPGRDAMIHSAIEDGTITWTQEKLEKYEPDMPPFFTFFDVYTLRKLLSEVGCTHLRFRKALIKTKTEKPQTQGQLGFEENFLNLIVEAVPTLVDKANITAIQANVLTDEDATAHDYGFPCPPKWIPVTNLLRGSGYGIINQSQMLRVANGISIRIGDVVTGIFNNAKAKELLKNWKIYPEPKTMRVFESGSKRRVILE